MLYEVAWNRALIMVLGSSTYAYTIMLATFLFGLALGAWLGTLLPSKSLRHCWPRLFVKFASP